MHFGGGFMQLRLIMGQALAAAKPWQRALIGAVVLAGGIALLLSGRLAFGVLLSVLGGLVLGRPVYGSLQRRRIATEDDEHQDEW